MGYMPKQLLHVQNHLKNILHSGLEHNGIFIKPPPPPKKKKKKEKKDKKKDKQQLICEICWVEQHSPLPDGN